MRNNLLRDALIAYIGRLGLHVVKRTSRDELEALIRSLRPRACNHELIRLGPEADGGYLIPDDFDGIAHAFSAGVADNSGFELDLARRGISVHLADHSVGGPALPCERFTFDRLFVGAYASETTMTLDQWCDRRAEGYSGDLLLKLDIEGAEFAAVQSMSPDLLRRCRIIVVEFHYLHQLWNKPWFRQVADVFRKLTAGHAVVHIHPNNCCGTFRSRNIEIPRVAEFTFLRRERMGKDMPRNGFPHPLDRDNTCKRTIVLPSCWYAS